MVCIARQMNYFRVKEVRMECYNCGATLNRKTRSAEHILPNSIGGKRKAYNLLCKTCNEMFGRTIDNELASKLAPIYSLLVSGEQPLKPNTSFLFKNDGTPIAYDRFLSSIKTNRAYSGNAGYFRSIAKICLNYYLSKGYSRQYIEPIKTFINGGNTDHIVHYYVPANKPLHILAENEVSHILHLHGSKESGILYAYIELFNMQNLVVVFSMDYDGKDIDVTYCRDLITNEEPSKKIVLSLTREQLEELGGLAAEMEARLKPPFERLLGIIQNRPAFLGKLC